MTEWLYKSSSNMPMIQFKWLQKTKNPSVITTKTKNIKKKIMNQTSSKWNWTQGEILQSNYSNHESFDYHSYFSMMSLNSVMITMIALLMIHYYQENYLTWKLLTDATFGMIISLMHNYHHRNLLYNKISQHKQTLKSNKISMPRKEQTKPTSHSIKIEHTQLCSS